MADLVPTGSPTTRLIIIRGNSGSGKSTVAGAVRTERGRRCALVQQDHFRRIVMGEHDKPGGHAIGLIANTVRFALDIGYDVVCEGIMHSEFYRPMLSELCAAHRGTTSVFYLDVSFDETVRRHATRPLCSEFTTADMRDWYLLRDVLGVEGEQVVDETSTLDETVRRIGSHFGA